jgi:predicted nuclease of predicted toxin-antitoxin system
VKLLFDHNISPALVSRLQDIFPGSNHVFRLTLHEASDAEVWDYAREHGFAIVTKDADFAELSLQQGFPPKIIWLRIGNCTSGEIEQVVRANGAAIDALFDDPERGVMALFRKD